jgi:HSP20 family molecular chaperone IbpA
MSPERAKNHEGHEPVVQPSIMSLPHSSGWNASAACIQPLHNLFVTAKEVVLTVDLPYVNQNQVRLTCPTDDCVEVYAETTRRITFKDLGVKHRHGEFTCYHARIQMPVPVDETKMQTKFKRGVLEIHLPRLS